MEFHPRKLPPEAALNLRICPIHTVRPFALMLAPVYVFMKLNGKFVSVKAPLDFFTPEELERLKPFESFFLPEFVDVALPFREAARSVLSLLTWQPKPKASRSTAKKSASELEAPNLPEIPLPPAPYELSDAILKILGGLWTPSAVADSSGAHSIGLEPFFIAVFANELCETLPGEMIRAARDADVAKFELAVFRSSWAVFLALHLGYLEMGFLNALRYRVFTENIGAASVTAESKESFRSEVDELVALANESLDNAEVRMIRESLVTGGGAAPGTNPRSSGRIAQKLTTRLERVKSQMLRTDQPLATIFGPKGFRDNTEGGAA